MSIALDLMALERGFERLNRFVEQCPLPLGRALAIAHFIRRLPHDLQGRSYYLGEIGGRFIETLEALKGAVADPEHMQLLADALAELERTGIVSDGEGRIAAALSDTAGRRPETESDSSLAQAGVPLVLALPALLGETLALGAGIATTLTVSPRARRGREPKFRWHNAHAAHPVAALRALEDVAADALFAATEAVVSFAGRRAPASDATPRSLPKRARRARAFSRQVGFDLSLPEKEIPIAGDSIGLALAVSFAGMLVGIACRGAGLRPRRDIAWTGAVRPSGSVAAVDPLSLRAKLRAAHFAGYRGIVVPAQMEDEARAEVHLQQLPLRVFGIGHVAEALANPEWVEPVTVPADIVEGCTREKRRRVLLLALAGAVGIFLAYHLPPHYARVEHGLNSDLTRVHYRGLWPEWRIQSNGNKFTPQVTHRLDGERPGAARMVIAHAYDSQTAEPSRLAIYDLAWRREIWSYTFTELGLPYEMPDSLVAGTYSAKGAIVGDFDGDHRDEIVVAGAYSPYALSFLWLFDGRREPSGAIFHNGHIEDLLASDLDGDGADEIVAAGFHGPSQGISLLVLKAGDFAPFRHGVAASNANPPWDAQAQRCFAHLVVPWPPELAPGEGRMSLGRSDRTPLTLVPRPPGGPLVRYDINVLGAWPLLTADYIVTFRPPCEEIEVTANATLRDRARVWWAERRTSVDLSSPEFLQAWRERFRCADHIQIGWPSDGVAPEQATGPGANQ
jgi:hypothetical protein